MFAYKVCCKFACGKPTSSHSCELAASLHDHLQKVNNKPTIVKSVDSTCNLADRFMQACKTLFVFTQLRTQSCIANLNQVCSKFPL